MTLKEWLEEYETSLQLAVYEGDSSRLVAKALLSLAQVTDLKPSDQEAKVRPSKSPSRGDTT